MWLEYKVFGVSRFIDLVYKAWRYSTCHQDLIRVVSSESQAGNLARKKLKGTMVRHI